MDAWFDLLLALFDWSTESTVESEVSASSYDGGIFPPPKP
jgi:hypothetical protein